MKRGSNPPDLSFLEGLKFFNRDDISPYDPIILAREPSYMRLQKEIDYVLNEMRKASDEMTNGHFKWDEEILPGKWQFSMRAIFRPFILMPERQMVDLTELTGFREVLDPFCFRIFMESSQEIFEFQERMKSLEIISLFCEAFMRLHLQADVSYLPKIDSRHIQLMDPFMRTSIRKSNRKNSQFQEKYLNDKFDIKKFCFDFLDRLFQTNNACALGSGLRRLRLNILKIIRILFELGMWTVAELPEILDTIHTKIPMFFCEETEFDDGYNCPESQRASVYDPIYHENIASIINHSTILHNDEAFMWAIDEKNYGKNAAQIDKH
jgi:hypothetical protein